MPVIGYLNASVADGYADDLRAFRQGLKESGYIEGENVAIEYRWGENQPDRLAGDGGRPRSPASQRDCRRQRACFGGCGQGDRDDPHRVPGSRRSGQAWPCHEPLAAGWQRDRNQFLRGRAGD